MRDRSRHGEGVCGAVRNPEYLHQLEREEGWPDRYKEKTLSELVLVGVFNGIGGARRALELLNIGMPDLYICIEIDGDCIEVITRAWPGARHLGDLSKITSEHRGIPLSTLFGAFSGAERIRCPESACVPDDDRPCSEASEDGTKN